MSHWIPNGPSPPCDHDECPPTHCRYEKVERETVAAIVAWLREGNRPAMGDGREDARDLADAIERLEWKRGKERGDG